MKHLIIIGGGAAGLAAAITAAKSAPELSVTVLERLDRVGKKILATGNGRCNLTNLRACAKYYESSRRDLLKQAFEGIRPEQTLDFFASMGLMCDEEAEGRVYPYCRQASMVLDVLRLTLGRLNIAVECSCAVAEIRREKGGFALRAADGRTFRGDAVILAAGGKAASKLGSDGSGFALAQQLGHSCTSLYPALTALHCDMTGHGGLKGIRAQAGVSLFAGRRLLGKDVGEVQFTEQGLSGIPVMQISGRLSALRKGEACTAQVDLFPGLTQEQIFQELKTRAREGTLETLLLGTIHKRLAYAVLKTAGLSPLSRENRSLRPAELQKLAETLKCWSFRVTGTAGWEAAQVTGGGVPLSEVDLTTFASSICPGLYLAGEVLDAVGACGGFNLHWAWCTGMKAGEAAAKAVSR